MYQWRESLYSRSLLSCIAYFADHLSHLKPIHWTTIQCQFIHHDTRGIRKLHHSKAQQCCSSAHSEHMSRLLPQSQWMLASNFLLEKMNQAIHQGLNTKITGSLVDTFICHDLSDLLTLLDNAVFFHGSFFCITHWHVHR